MITAFYASLLTLLLCVLALKVIKARRYHKVGYADGGITDMQVVRAAHSNAVDYIPITVILLFFLEYQGAAAWLIHSVGVVFILGRLIHARSILAKDFKGRVRGMQITIWVMITLAVLNSAYYVVSTI